MSSQSGPQVLLFRLPCPFLLALPHAAPRGQSANTNIATHVAPMGQYLHRVTILASGYAYSVGKLHATRIHGSLPRRNPTYAPRFVAQVVAYKRPCDRTGSGSMILCLRTRCTVTITTTPPACSSTNQSTGSHLTHPMRHTALASTKVGNEGGNTWHFGPPPG